MRSRSGTGQALDQPRIAFGPGEHRFALAGIVAGQLEAVAAREVVQAGPCRHGVEPGAIVVAARVVEVPEQQRVVEPLAREPLRERQRHRVPRAPHATARVASASRRPPRARSASTRSRNARYCAVVRERRCGRRQQAVVPGAVEEQPLLRAVAQVALVGHGAAGHAAQQAQTRTAVRSPRGRAGPAAADSAHPVGQPLPPSRWPRLLPPGSASSSSTTMSSTPERTSARAQAKPGDAGADHQHVGALARPLAAMSQTPRSVNASGGRARAMPQASRRRSGAVRSREQAAQAHQRGRAERRCQQRAPA